MFRFLGAVIRRTWPVWLIAWLALYGILYHMTPPWEEVAQDREFGFLPEDSPTRQGQALYKQAFPNEQQTSNIVVFVSRADGELRDEDRKFVKEVVKPALMKVAQDEGGLADKAPAGGAHTSIIASIRAFDDPRSGVLMDSNDRHATMVVLYLTTELLERRNWPLVEKIQSLIAQWREQGKAPAGLEVTYIGSASVGRDMTLGQRQSASATEFWTVLIVIAILVVIYRAPFLAIIPLVSVFMATQISMMLLSQLSLAGYVTLFEGIQIYITVILYGTGVDYCLFLIARYREEREQGAEWGDALAQAIGHVGPALAASAATVMFGIGMMVFAKFGKFHHAGVAVAFGLAVSLCVVLTFTTSLLRLAGRWAFWPFIPVPASSDGEGVAAAATGWRARLASSIGWLSWDGLGRALVRSPVLIWVATVLLMTPLAIGGVLHADDVDYDFVRRLSPDAPAVAGTKAMEEHFPAGAAGIITVLLYHPHLDFLEKDSKGQIELAVLTKQLADQQTALRLADIRSYSRPVGTGWMAIQTALALSPEERARGMKEALKYYVSSSDGPLKGHVTRLELTMLQQPMSRQGIASLDHLEKTIRSELYGDLRDAKLYFLGVSADMRELRHTTGDDQTRVQILVVSCVLAILVILLRRPVVSLYLIASVLYSYFATLGATYWFFEWWDPGNFVGLDWKTPIFLFTILVAIGEDYNIFLMTRVSEEQARHDPINGIRIALVKTGRIITSCGIIMAGTFASLLSGSMQDLQHLGFALTCGVLMDTFLVRPILVPAFLIFLERCAILWRRFGEPVETASSAQEPALHR